MSALGRAGAVERPVGVESAVRTLRVRWIVSLPALAGGLERTPELAGAIERWSAQGVEPTLEWTVEEENAALSARAVLHGPGAAVPIYASNGTTTVRVTEDPRSAARHVEVRENGEVLLSAALDCSAGQTLYASTALLARLGLGGGRYEVARQTNG